MCLLVDILTTYTAVFWIGNTVHIAIFCAVLNAVQGKGKAFPVQDLRVPMQSAHDGGKVVSPMHRLPLPPGNVPGTHF